MLPKAMQTNKNMNKFEIFNMDLKISNKSFINKCRKFIFIIRK